MSWEDRPYDLVLFGATGYTGRLSAQHISLRLPTNLKWAIAGRTFTKLEAIVSECKTLNSNRIPPAIELCSMNGSELSSLAQKTKLFISTVGPYTIYGEPAFKSCAANGTHYLDITGEVPWTAKMIRKYEMTAKANGSIMIPQCGFESAPADLITYALVTMIRQKLAAPTKEVTVSVQDLNPIPSGGTSLSFLTVMERFSIADVAATHQPYSLSPIPGPDLPGTLHWTTKVFGIINIPVLGLNTSSVAAIPDRPIVHRSWGLFGGPDFYGPNFHFHEFRRTSNVVIGTITHLALSFMALFFAFPLSRWFARFFIYQPGQGPDVAKSMRNDRVSYKAVAVPDLDGEKVPTAYCEMKYKGGLYGFTAVLLTNAAMTILYDDSAAKKLGGGILTPATLGQNYIDRLNEDGVTFDFKMLDN